jgi:hypothetical protein
MTYMNTGEAGNASISLGPEHITVGGHATQPLDMGENAKKMGNASEYVYDWLKKAYITKDEAKAEAFKNWFAIAVGSAITLIVTGGFVTVGGMLALVPLTFSAIYLGPNVFVGALVSATHNYVNFFILGLSVGLALYYSKLMIDPNGDVYLIGSAQN